METLDTMITLGISVGLGLLVGLQRERKGEEIAGIRTFALLTLFGTLCGLLGKDVGPWVVASGALGVAALMVAGAWMKAKRNMQEIGLTTEYAALVMYGLGAYLAQGNRTVAVVTGGAVALLLYWKEPLHGFVRKMGDRDISAIMQFVLITLVILPILPREKMGPYGVLNPFEIWLVVVLVVGMSLAGYVLYKLVPPRAGSLIGGMVGGLVSSTATTVSYARRSREDPFVAPLALQAIMTANTVSVLRVMALLSVFTGGTALAMLQPLALMSGAMAMLTVIAYLLGSREADAKITYGNPAELQSALFFGGLFAVVRLATAFARDRFGTSALYGVAALSGLTDMDAITLSISDMAKNGRVQASLAGEVLLVALLSNLVFKGGCVLFLGDGRLRREVALLFGGAMVIGAIIFVAYYPRT